MPKRTNDSSDNGPSAKRSNNRMGGLSRLAWSIGSSIVDLFSPSRIQAENDTKQVMAPIPPEEAIMMPRQSKKTPRKRNITPKQTVSNPHITRSKSKRQDWSSSAEISMSLVELSSKENAKLNTFRMAQLRKTLNILEQYGCQRVHFRSRYKNELKDLVARELERWASNLLMDGSNDHACGQPSSITELLQVVSESVSENVHSSSYQHDDIAMDAEEEIGMHENVQPRLSPNEQTVSPEVDFPTSISFGTISSPSNMQSFTSPDHSPLLQTDFSQPSSRLLAFSEFISNDTSELSVNTAPSYGSLHQNQNDICTSAVVTGGSSAPSESWSDVGHINYRNIAAGGCSSPNGTGTSSMWNDYSPARLLPGDSPPDHFPDIDSRLQPSVPSWPTNFEPLNVPKANDLLGSSHRSRGSMISSEMPECNNYVPRQSIHSSYRVGTGTDGIQVTDNTAQNRMNHFEARTNESINLWRNAFEDNYMDLRKAESDTNEAIQLLRSAVDDPISEEARKAIAEDVEYDCRGDIPKRHRTIYTIRYREIRSFTAEEVVFDLGYDYKKFLPDIEEWAHQEGILKKPHARNSK